MAKHGNMAFGCLQSPHTGVLRMKRLYAILFVLPLLLFPLAGQAEVSVYTQGTPDVVPEDVYPVLSDSSGYVEKWEFYIYTRPYEIRLKFEISNFAFSKNEGKVSGHVKKWGDTNELLAEYKISKSYKSSEWTAAKNALNLKFGDYTLTLDEAKQQFRLAGSYEKGTFDVVIPANYWKPGTGNVIFGDSAKNVFKYALLSYHRPVTSSVVVEDGVSYQNEGPVYANHYATTMAVYDMFDELGDFRHRTDDLLVEFRYYVPSQKHQAEPFGFMFVAWQGTPILSSTHIERTPLDTWLDEDNYGYEIDARQKIVATDDGTSGNRAEFVMNSADPIPSDPYAKLPAFQRNVASRFAKPIEYKIKAQWDLLLHVDGFDAKIPKTGEYSLTRMR